MPYTIKTKDGIEVRDIPDDMAKDDPRLKEMVSGLRSAGQKVVSFGGGQTQQEPQKAQSGQFGEFIEGAAQGLKEGTSALVRGAAGGIAGTVGLVSDPITALINTALPEEYRGKPAAEAIQELLTRLGVPESETAAQKIVQAGASGLAGGGSTALAGKAIAGGAALAPTVVQRIGQAVASQPVQQMTGGAGANIASQLAEEAGGNELVQAGAGLAGGIIGGGVGGGVKAVPTKTAPIEEASQAGIRLMTSDVRPPSTFAGKWLQGLGEKVPITGTGSVRMAQQGERVAAVRDLVRQFGAEDLAASSDDVMRDLLGKRASDLKKWSGAKNEVIDAIASKTSEPVQMASTTKKIDDSISSLRSLKTEQVNPVISILEDWKQAIQGQDIKNVETLRKQIGEAFKAPELASVRSTGEKVLSDIYSSVKDDMTNYIKNNGGEVAVTKWNVANKELSKMMGELELPALKSAIEKGETTPEIINNLLFSKKRSDVESLYRNLSPNGKAAARSAIIAKAAEKAGGSDISPDKFASEVKKLGGHIGIVFGEDDSKQVRGLVRVLDATKRASQSSAMPPTGIQAVLPTGAAALASFFGGGLEGFVGTMAAGAGIGGAARIYESKPVRDILMKIPSVKPGSNEEAVLFKRLFETAQSVKQQSPDSAK